MNTTTPPELFIEDDILPHLIQYCRARQFDQFMLVAEAHTHAALGQRVEQALRANSFDVRTVVFRHHAEVVADEAHLIEVLAQADAQARTYLAVGSGTITDIVRFVSHRTRNSFISIPTAPSVDGFVSIGAPLVIGGLKETIVCAPPIAAFADLGTLAAAPRPMIAAGFGDMLGKFTSLADWKIGHLLGDERYDEQVAQHTWRALQACISAIQANGRIRAHHAGLRSAHQTRGRHRLIQDEFTLNGS
jgi:glycerol-1-phosphate dehydrogenase [NAD(P)+]